MPKYWGKVIYRHGSFPEVGENNGGARKHALTNKSAFEDVNLIKTLLISILKRVGSLLPIKLIVE